MKRRIAVAAFAFLIGPAAARADAPRLDRVLASMDSVEKGIDHIRFDFRQDITFKSMASSSTVVGHAVFGKGGRLRVEKKEPDRQITVSNGRSLWVYTPSYNQVWQGNWKSWLDSTMLPKGMVPLDHYVSDLQKDFTLSLLPSDDATTVRLKAVPKDASLGYTLTFVVSSDTWLPVETHYESDSADVVTRLSDVEVNPAVPDSLFRFNVPKGADVIPLN